MAPLEAMTKLAKTRALEDMVPFWQSTPPSIVSGNLYLEYMIIDCDTCTMRDLACKECVVSFLIDTPSIEAEDSRVIDLLASRGMIPPLRFENGENSQRAHA